MYILMFICLEKKNRISTEYLKSKTHMRDLNPYFGKELSSLVSKASRFY